MANKTAPAVKVVLGKRPKSFTKDITFPMLDDSTGCMQVTYKYRSRTEFAAFVDSVRAGLKAKSDAAMDRFQQAIDNGEPAPEITQVELVTTGAEYNVDYIMGCVDGWNLDVPFDKGAVEELVDTLPAAVTAIVTAYRDVITEGRLGNLKP
jgi:hypothetical protein